MYLINGKTFQKLTREDIEAAVNAGLFESQNLDFKRDWIGKTDDEKYKFLSDICGFANAGGGVILYGVDETRENGNATGKASEACGVTVEDLPAELSRVRNILNSSLISPSISGVEFKELEGFRLGHLVAIYIPKSWVGPHRLNKGDWSKYCLRTGTSTTTLDNLNLKSAFLSTDVYGEKFSLFRSERLGRILANETNPLLMKGPKLVLHMKPFASTPTQQIAVEYFEKLQSDKRLDPMLHDWGSTWRIFNADGYLSCDEIDEKKGGFGYVQFYRDGGLEAITTGCWSDDSQKIIWTETLETALKTKILDYGRCLQETGCTAPLAVGVSLVEVGGFSLRINSERFYSRSARPLDRNVLMLPTSLVSSIEKDLVDEAIANSLKVLWQACNFAKAPTK